MDGRTEILLSFVDLLTPPRKHRHWCCGALAPAANLRRAVTATEGTAGTVLQALEAAREAMAWRPTYTDDWRPCSARRCSATAMVVSGRAMADPLRPMV